LAAVAAAGDLFPAAADASMEERLNVQASIKQKKSGSGRFFL